MKTKLFGDWYANLAQAALDLLIGAVESGVPINAAIENPDELGGQRVANGEPTTAVGHRVRVRHILLHALRIPTDVIHLIMIVFLQNIHQILGEKNGVIVAHHEPPHIFRPQLKTLLHDARNPDRRARAVPAAVLEPGRIPGNFVRRRGLRPSHAARRLLLEPNEPAGDVRLPPKLRVMPALAPRLSGASDAEQKMGYICLFVTGEDINVSVLLVGD